MFRELGSKIVKFCKDEYAIKKDAKNLILWGGMLVAVLATAVTKSQQIIPRVHLSPIQPPTRLNTPIKRLQPRLPSTWSNLLRL